MLEDPGDRRRRKQVSQPIPPFQGGSRGSTADEQRLSQRASSQGGRASQSEARPASQASSSQVLQFHMNFLHFHHDRLAKQASDMMLVAATGCTDAFWRPLAWYLNIPVDLPPEPGPEKMEKMDKIIVIIEKILVRMEKILVRIKNCCENGEMICMCLADLELLPRGRNS
jgi:hypothetical protein